MVSQDNINTVRKLFDFLNKNDLSQLKKLEDYFSSHVMFHDPVLPSAKSGIELVKQAEHGYITAFPDKKVHIDSLLPTEDRVVVRWTATGTHKGKFRGIAPTNNPFSVSGITIYTIVDGKITEAWQVWDCFGLCNQLHVQSEQLLKAA